MPAISIDLGQSSPAEGAALWLAATKTEKVQLRVPASGAPMPDNFDNQSKTLEEAEANAIGTEYLRADLLPEETASRTRELLSKYLDLRIAFYEEAKSRPASDIAKQTANVQGEMWSVVRSAATSQPTPTIALVVSGMNEVINAQGFTQHAWWNRIPKGAWAMMALMALSGNLLGGYGERRKCE